MNSAAMLYQRRSTILAFTFVELLILMVFASIMFALAIEREVKVEADQLAIKLRQANEKIKSLTKENLELKAKIRELEIRLKQYRLSDGSYVDSKAVKRYISNSPPPCKIPDDFLFQVNLLETGDYEVIKTSWFYKSGSDSLVAEIPGLSKVLNAKTLSTSELRFYGRKIYDYSQTNKCRYRVNASSTVQHTDLSLYLIQMSNLDKYFYTRKPKRSR